MDKTYIRQAIILFWYTEKKPPKMLSAEMSATIFLVFGAWIANIITSFK